MPENIDEILARLRTKIEGAPNARFDPDARPLPDFMPRNAAEGDEADASRKNSGNNPKTSPIDLNPDQIISAVFVIAPAQISYIAEVFANNVANALNMRAFAPRIRKIAEQSLREALGTAKKMGGKFPS